MEITTCFTFLTKNPAGIPKLVNFRNERQVLLRLGGSHLKQIKPQDAQCFMSMAFVPDVCLASCSHINYAWRLSGSR
jgi:hypothetical protein